MGVVLRYQNVTDLAAFSSEWNARFLLCEEEGTTTVRVVLDTGATALTGHGVAHCHPGIGPMGATAPTPRESPAWPGVTVDAGPT